MTRICLKPADIAALRRDGLGWGHDLECGSVHIQGDVPRRTGLFAQFRHTLPKKEVL